MNEYDEFEDGGIAISQRVRTWLRYQGAGFLWRRFVFYVFVIVTVLKVMVSDLFLNDFNFIFFVTHILYFENALGMSKTYQGNDLRVAPSVILFHPLSFTSSFLCAVTFAMVASFCNTSYISDLASMHSVSEVVVWMSEVFQAVFPLLAHLIDLILSKNLLKYFHALHSIEDKWSLTPIKWLQTVWYIISTPIVLFCVTFIPNSAFSAEQVYGCSVNVAEYILLISILVLGPAVMVVLFYRLRSFMDDNIDGFPSETIPLASRPLAPPTSSAIKRSNVQVIGHTEADARRSAASKNTSVSELPGAGRVLSSEYLTSYTRAYPPVAEDWPVEQEYSMPSKSATATLKSEESQPKRKRPSSSKKRPKETRASNPVEVQRRQEDSRLKANTFSSLSNSMDSNSIDVQALEALLLDEDFVLASATIALGVKNNSLLSAMVNVYIKEEAMHDLLRHMTSSEVRLSDRATLFAEYSPTGRMIEFYGYRFLRTHVQEHFGKILSSYLANPKSFDLSDSASTPAANKQNLIDLCNDLFSAICDSIPSLPTSLFSAVLHEADEEIVVHYGGHQYDLIARILFNHIYKHVIMIPSEYGIGNEYPNKGATQNLSSASLVIYHIFTNQQFAPHDFHYSMNKYVREKASLIRPVLKRACYQKSMAITRSSLVSHEEFEESFSVVQSFIVKNIDQLGQLLGE